MPLPIAHTAAGLLVYAATPHKLNKKLSGSEKVAVIAFALFLANCPDLDFLPGIATGSPNRFHHGISHSAFMAIVVVGLTYFCARKFVRTMSGKALFAISLLSCLSHSFLDYFASDTSFPYGVPLFWPITDAYFVSPFPLFRDVERDGTTTASFLKTLVNDNNLWEVIVEILFAGLLFFLLLLGKERSSKVKFSALACGAGFSALLYYGMQIEPNLIEVNRYEIFSPHLKRDVRVALISDFHLKNISYKENKINQMLTDQIQPDILLFSGDTFDPYGEEYKTELSEKLIEFSNYIEGLPGEKYLVWGEGIVNNRHLLGKKFTARGVTVLEDESVATDNFPEMVISGKLPELASFILLPKPGGTSCLSATDTQLNSFLHYHGENSQELSNYEFHGEFQFNKNAGGMGLTFYSQYSRFSDKFYRIRWTGLSPVPEISPHGAGPVTGKTKAGHLLQPGQQYLFRIQCKTEQDVTRIFAKFWLKESREPDEWDISGVDSSENRLTSGTIGVWVNGPAGEKLFDNFMVQTIHDRRILFVEQFDDPAGFVNRWRSERAFVDKIASPPGDTVNILLAHSPEIVHQYKMKNFDIILTGDTHGGQVCWPWGTPIFWDKNLPKEWHAGLHKTEGDIPVFISKGIGVSRLPVRLFCRPEIAVFDFHSTGKNNLRK